VKWAASSVGGIAFSVNGAKIGTRYALNLIAGANVTLAGVDNTALQQVDVTISAAGGGGGSQNPRTSKIDAAGVYLWYIGWGRITGGLPAANAPNTFGLDFDSGCARIVSWGPDATTAGGLKFVNLNADGSGAAERLRITAAGYVGIGNPGVLPDTGTANVHL